jgi:hypothetical protein
MSCCGAAVGGARLCWGVAPSLSMLMLRLVKLRLRRRVCSPACAASRDERRNIKNDCLHSVFSSRMSMTVISPLAIATSSQYCTDSITRLPEECRLQLSFFELVLSLAARTSPSRMLS